MLKEMGYEPEKELQLDFSQQSAEKLTKTIEKNQSTITTTEKVKIEL